MPRDITAGRCDSRRVKPDTRKTRREYTPRVKPALCREVLDAASYCGRDRLVRSYDPPLQAGTALARKQKSLKYKSALVSCSTSIGSLLTSEKRAAAVLQLLVPSLACVPPSPWKVGSPWIRLWRPEPRPQSETNHQK